MSELYKVKPDGKEERQRLNRKAGELETYYLIHATSAGGTDFTVEVKVDELAKADAILSARAKALDAIS